jgi:hypothetical protein
VNRGSKFKKALGHAFAEPSPAAGYENTFRLQDIVAEHADLSEKNYRL